MLPGILTAVAVSAAATVALATASIDNYSLRYFPGVNTKKEWNFLELWETCNTSWSTTKWLCNPDGILSKAQEETLEWELHSGPSIQERACVVGLDCPKGRRRRIHSAPSRLSPEEAQDFAAVAEADEDLTRLRQGQSEFTGGPPLSDLDSPLSGFNLPEEVGVEEWCPVELRMVMVRELDKRIVFLHHGYGNAVSYLASRLADKVMDSRHRRPFCCHSVVLLLSYHQGQVYYGLASCKLFKLPYCRIMSLFNRHQSALYKRDYFHFGLRQFWNDFREEFAKPQPEENCNPFKVTSTPATATATPTLTNTHSPSLLLLTLFFLSAQLFYSLLQ